MSHQSHIKEIYPAFHDVGYYFKKYLDLYITPASRLLDIGCGHQAFGEDYYRRAAWRIGIDPDQRALDTNTLMDEKICCNIADIPASAGTFDVIVGQWVLEHVPQPDTAVRRIASLCRPGGYFIFMTTNVLAPLIALSKILPTAWKKYLRRTLLHIEEADTYPTVYRINSVAAIERYFSAAGFTRVQLQRVAALHYFSFNKFILRLAVFMDKVFGKLNFGKAHIVGVYRKNK